MTETRNIMRTLTRDDIARRIDDLLAANNRFEQRAREAERVCKAVAATNPFDTQNGYCAHCSAGEDDHDVDCLWLRAKAIAEAPKHD